MVLKGTDGAEAGGIADVGGGGKVLARVLEGLNVEVIVEHLS